MVDAAEADAHVTLPVAETADLHFVTPYLAVGGELDPFDRTRRTAQVAELCALGITHVVDARSEAPDHGLVRDLAPQLRYLPHGVADSGRPIPAAWFEHAVGWIEKAWAQDPNAVVLTHCQAGRNRGPSLGFAVLLARGVGPVPALAAIRSARAKADAYYAADALTWHLDRVGADAAYRAEQRAALDAWRWEHMPDVMSLIEAVDELRAQPAEDDW